MHGIESTLIYGGYDVALIDVEEWTPHIQVYPYEKLPAESKEGEWTWLISYGKGWYPEGTKQIGYFKIDSNPARGRIPPALNSSGPSVVGRGDSGGPLFRSVRVGERVHSELVGVAISKSNNESGDVSHFTNLRAVHDWVLAPERMNVFWPEVPFGQLVNRAHGSCVQRLERAPSSPLLVHSSCLSRSKDASKTWSILPDPGRPNTYHISNNLDLKCLNGEGRSPVMRDCQRASATQRWVIEPVDNEDTIQLRNEVNGLCVSVQEYVEGQSYSYLLELDDCTPRPGNHWMFL